MMADDVVSTGEAGRRAPALTDFARELAKDLSEDAAKPLPPVELWNPPFCGDIDMRIAHDGSWLYQGSPINRPGLVRLFSSILRKDPDRYVLVTPAERVGIAVADAPFIAVEMAVAGQGGSQTLNFRTNVGDWVHVDADHPLRFDRDKAGGVKPYVLVRGGLWALVKRALAMDLIALCEYRASGGAQSFGVASAGAFFKLADAQEIAAIEARL
jgi:uncharacterized protein